MIVGDLKPIEEIQSSTRGKSRVLILGCRGCVTVCNTGGEKEVAVLASQLRIANQAQGDQQEVCQATIERQCDFEYIEPVLLQIQDVDELVEKSLAFDLSKNVYPDGSLHQRQCVFPNGESETAAESYGPKDPSGILNKGEIV